MALTSGSASFNIHDQSMWRKVRTTFPDDNTYREPSRGWEAPGLEPTGLARAHSFFHTFCRQYIDPAEKYRANAVVSGVFRSG
jgi:hypothetical protein